MRHHVAENVRSRLKEDCVAVNTSDKAGEQYLMLPSVAGE